MVESFHVRPSSARDQPADTLLYRGPLEGLKACLRPGGREARGGGRVGWGGGRSGSWGQRMGWELKGMAWCVCVGGGGGLLSHYLSPVHTLDMIYLRLDARIACNRGFDMLNISLVILCYIGQSSANLHAFFTIGLRIP